MPENEAKTGKKAVTKQNYLHFDRKIASMIVEYISETSILKNMYAHERKSGQGVVILTNKA